MKLLNTAGGAALDAYLEQENPHRPVGLVGCVQLGHQRDGEQLKSRNILIASDITTDARLPRREMSSIVSLVLRLMLDGLSSHARVIQTASVLFKKGGISKLKISHAVTGWLANTDLDFQPPPAAEVANTAVEGAQMRRRT